MGQARQTMDRLTEAIFSRDWEAVADLYAPDAVAVTPDQGEVRGNQAVAEWSREFLEAFPDARYESGYAHESDNTAIDEGYVTGTNTGPLVSPTGESIPATGRALRLRACDIGTVEDGVITSHRFYFDQMEFMGQLGLLEEETDLTTT